MIKPAPPPKRGIAAMFLLFCVVALIAGLVFEFMTPAAGPRFGVVTQPGGRAVLGLGAVAVLVFAAHAMRMLLTARSRGDGDADHA